MAWDGGHPLTTALNMSYMAERLSVFGLAVGIALLLTGVGRFILAFAVFGRREEASETVRARSTAAPVVSWSGITGGPDRQDAPTSRSAGEGRPQPPSPLAAGVRIWPQRGSAPGPMLGEPRDDTMQPSERRDAMKVQDIMSRDVLTIGPEGEIRDVARILTERHISGLPVCDAERRVVGIVSEGDILFKEYGQHPARRYRYAGLTGRRHAKEATKARAINVRDAMTTPAITVSPYCSVAEAAQLMTEHRINRLPVVKGDELVGIVTRTDLVRAFVRSDEDIRHEIREDLLLKTLWIEASEAICVSVERGAVRLSGRLEKRSDAPLLERLVTRVPGVVSVESELSWTIDDTTRNARRELRSTQEPVGRG